MAIQTFNIGSSPNDRTGDTLRSTGAKLNQNFQDLDERVNAAIPGAQKGVANGVAPLGPDGKIANSFLGPIVSAHSAAAIPTQNVGPIEVAGMGLMEWNGATARYESVAAPHGQCRLVYAGPNELRLVRHNGKYLMIGGRVYSIQADGVPFSSAGLPPGGNFYLFAKGGTNGAISLEALQFSTGATHGRDPSTGVEVLSGDASRTLVGMFGTSMASTFLYDTSSRLVASWFNRRKVAATNYGSSMSTSSQTYVLSNWDARIMTWEGEVDLASMYGIGTNSTGLTASYAILAIHGSLSGPIAAIAQPGVASQHYTLAQSWPHVAAWDGPVVCQTAIRVGGSGTGSFQLAATIEATI